MLNRTVSLLLAVSLSGCPKSAVTLEEGWLDSQPLTALPVDKLSTLRLGGSSWEDAARALRMSPDDFYTDRWGGIVVHVLRDSGSALAIYEEPGGGPHGVIVRSREGGVPVEDVESMLINTAAKADHGETWSLYKDPSYVRLVSSERPVVEVGCQTNRSALLCHFKVFRSDLTAAEYPSFLGSDGVSFIREVSVP